MHRLKTLPTAAMLMALTYCAPPPPPPAPAPPPRAPTPPPPPPVASDWRDAPLTIGMWRYQRRSDGSEAVFGDARAQTGAVPPLAISCAVSTRTVGISVRGSGTASLLVRTTFGDTRIAVETGGSPENLRLVGRWAAYDPFLDKLAYSLGRFVVASGTERLIFPVQPEIARVIEDCRG